MIIISKQKYQHKQNHVIINHDDHSFLNRKDPYDPSEFDTSIHPVLLEVICDYLNKLRIEYIALSYNGEPKSKYKPEVREKILNKKNENLLKKDYKAWVILKYLNIKYKEEFS